MKKIPNTKVKANPTRAFFLSPLITAWWDQVAVAPEDNNTAVFNRGTSKGFMASIPTGGHIDPISIVGPKEEWKNAQKNEKKKQTSRNNGHDYIINLNLKMKSISMFVMAVI